MIYLAALSLGLFGSLHCVGMCGPIALAIPLTSSEKRTILFQSLVYQVGRICTYSLLGAVMGFLGWGIALSGYQKFISISLGLVLIFTAVFSISLENKLLKIEAYNRFLSWLKTNLSNLLSIKNNSSAFRIGLLNGFLPCGLVYIALAGALGCTSILSGSFYMMTFGIGTLPLMLAVMVFGKFNRRIVLNFQKVIPIGLILFGIILIYRGIILDVPIDLMFWESNNFPPLCH